MGSLVIGLVNGALVISAGVALVAHQQVLHLSPRQRQGLINRLQKGLPLPASLHQQALVLGLVAGATTYTFSALWHSTHSLLIALLLTGQGVLALYALGALVRSSRSASLSRERWNAAPLAQVDYNLALLSHPDPLKRLVAVRRLARLASEEDYGAGVKVRSHLIDCFQLLLAQETEAIVRSALEEALAALELGKSLSSQTAKPWTAGALPESSEVAIASHVDSPQSDSTLPMLEANSSAAAIAPYPSSSEAISTSPSAPQGRRPTVEYVELDI